eukprot:TRINITY_DN662_c2_g1_i1.p1 TRINITY_DN662_c2_g1~~TRINITY_DN662_c2_g1_i1.p1  ORF type:complete len:127 (+),score=19.78 TRINITY_DN662_c2_g1_i1:14-394(+)
MYIQESYVNRGYFATLGLLIGITQVEELLSAWYMIPDEAKIIKAAISTYFGAIIGGVSSPLRVVVNMHLASKLEYKILQTNVFFPTANDLTQYESGFALAVVFYSLTPPSLASCLFQYLAARYEET